MQNQDSHYKACMFFKSSRPYELPGELSKLKAEAINNGGVSFEIPRLFHGQYLDIPIILRIIKDAVSFCRSNRSISEIGIMIISTPEYLIGYSSDGWETDLIWPIEARIWLDDSQLEKPRLLLAGI